jgi:hypothetical protein
LDAKLREVDLWSPFAGEQDCLHREGVSWER